MKTEEAYAEQVRERLERGLRRRAKELGYELKPAGAGAGGGGGAGPGLRRVPREGR